VKTEVSSLDQTDYRILDLLQRDGRITNQQLAHRVGMSPGAMHERVRKLRASGIVTGIHATLDAKRLDFGLLVFLQVQMERTTSDLLDEFAQRIQEVPEVLECHMIAGGFDFLLKIRVKDMAAFRQLLAELFDLIPAIRGTNSHAVMQEVKSTTALPLRRR
jgi:Lrp/AsnC family leucine-responsive transcriptional regulator